VQAEAPPPPSEVAPAPRRPPAPVRRPLRRRILLLLAFMGPGIIAANAGNDAGGIATYASAGAQFGYRTLFAMVLVTVALVVVQEMCARLGAYTGQGLGALIREQFSIRVTAFALVALIVANVGLVVSEFAGIAAAMELLGVSKFISVPVAAVAIWALVVFGSY
jgi:NRAMP (natural resistance-associated macrophage protein)-like metal ion transporter